MWTPIYAVHNNDAVWPDADKFQPERWLEPGADYVQFPAAGSAAGGGSGKQQVSRAPGGGDDAFGRPHGSGSAVGSKALSFEMNISRVKVSSPGHGLAHLETDTQTLNTSTTCMPGAVL